MRRTRRIAAAVALLSLALAAPTAAAAPPELFVRQQTWDTHEQTGEWIPLASAPAFDWLGGYEIGYRLQQDGFQRVALTVAGVPDGQPTQPSAATPYCVGRNGAAGTIEPAGPELQFEGSGAYTVRVSVSPGDGGPAGCLSGESTTASFAVAGLVAPALSGAPRSFRAIPLRADEFAGVRAPAPPGGQADLHCGRDGTVQPDGSVAGAPVITRAGPEFAVIREDTFGRPGRWTCVARGTAEGQDDNNDTAVFGTPWSAPITVVVRSDFRRRTGELKRLRARRPRFTFTAEWPEEARGGRASVTLLRVAGCKGRRYKLRAVGTYSGRFGARAARVRVLRPRRAGYYIGRFGFGGTQLLVAGEDPAPMLLLVRRGRLEYVPAAEFPRCPGYRP